MMLEDILSELTQEAQLTAADIQILENQFKEKAFKAIDAVVNRVIEFYQFWPSGREFWAVPGKEKTHLILRNTFCDCTDFYLNVVIKGKNQCCYHLLAVELANKLAKYTTISISDEKYKQCRNKFK